MAMTRPVVVVLTTSALGTARRVAGALGGAAIHGLAGRVEDCDVRFEDAGAHVRSLFAAGVPIVALFSLGALVRLLAPVLGDKRADPPVLAVAEDGSHVVPVLGGHHGANDLARRMAAALGTTAAVTTAGDLRYGIALDEPPQGWVLANPQSARQVMAELLSGATVRLNGSAPWLESAHLPIAPDGTVTFTVTYAAHVPAAHELLYHPRSLVVGVGCERGCEPADLVAHVRRTLDGAGLAAAAVAAVASLDLKADEPAVHAVAAELGVPARFFGAGALEAETPRLASPSDAVFAEVGCHGVAEAAALAVVGKDGALVVPKTRALRATCAVARATAPVDPAAVGRARGHLAVVGVGPGSPAWRSPEASDLIAGADDLVGYSLYLDLVVDIAGDKPRHDFPLGGEEDRVRHALELAGRGRDVALVCSGDAGIYAMAALVYEVLDRGDGDGGVSPAARRVAVTVAPGISALQAAAARTGAPLGHDFCAISLSDLLTPWDVIESRVRAAAAGDFVVAFYNPVSRRRRTQLARARDILLAHRPAGTPVILATGLGRPGESHRIVALAELDVEEVDMLTVVIVGSTETKVLRRGDGRDYVFTPRGYAAKALREPAQ